MTWSNLPEELDSPSELGDLRPHEVLYEFEGPCIFTTKAPGGGLLLAYLVEELELEEPALFRYLLTTTTEQTIDALRQGTMSVRDALTQGWMWLADLDVQHTPRHLYKIDPDRLPDDALPLPDTMLWPSLEPALRVRLVGSEIRRGSIPANVIAQAGEIASRSLKSIFDFLGRDMLAETVGRPPDWLRNLYSLPTQRLVFHSLALDFREPRLEDIQLSIPFSDTTIESLNDLRERGWRMLQHGIEWATRPDENLALADNDDERIAILEALKKLAPNATGPIVRVDISGTRVGGLEVVRRLDREASHRIRSDLAGLKRRKGVELRLFRGRVRELDLDKMSFLLRDTPADQPDEIAFVTDDEQAFDVAREASYRESDIMVSARRTSSNRWTVVDIEFAMIEHLDNPGR